MYVYIISRNETEVNILNETEVNIFKVAMLKLFWRIERSVEIQFYTGINRLSTVILEKHYISTASSLI